MPGQTFESALAECLAAVDRGESLPSVLARHPAHADAVRAVLEVRAELARGAVEVSPAAAFRGEQRLRAALASSAPTGGMPALSSLFSMIPKAVAQALIGLAIAGGAVGASAAAGGPNLPAAVLHAVGFASDDAGAGASASDTDVPQGGSASDGAPERSKDVAAHPTSTPRAVGDVRGLCQSFLRGGLGQGGQGTPESLRRLLAAADASGIADLEARNDAVERYCRTVVGVTPRPTASATATPGIPGPGNASEGPGRGNGPERGADGEAGAPPKGDRGHSGDAPPEPGSGLTHAAEQRSDSASGNHAPSSPPGLGQSAGTPGNAPPSPPGWDHAPGGGGGPGEGSGGGNSGGGGSGGGGSGGNAGGNGR